MVCKATDVFITPCQKLSTEDDEEIFSLVKRLFVSLQQETTRSISILFNPVTIGTDIFF